MPTPAVPYSVALADARAELDVRTVTDPGGGVHAVHDEAILAEVDEAEARVLREGGIDWRVVHVFEPGDSMGDVEALFV